MSKRVTSPKKRRKDILKRMVYYRDAHTRRGFNPVNGTDNVKGEALDAALSYIEVAKQQQIMRDEDWASSRAAAFGQGRGPPVPAGGSPKGYSKPKRMPEPYPWPNTPRPTSAQESLFQAAACILAELERMQYTDEVALGYKKLPEPNPLTQIVWTDSNPPWTTRTWSSPISTATTLGGCQCKQCKKKRLRADKTNATATAIIDEASSLILST